jgi:hypothetical protein
MAERVLITITTTNDGEAQHVLTLDSPLEGRSLGDLHEVARTAAEGVGILGPQTRRVVVDVAFAR